MKQYPIFIALLIAFQFKCSAQGFIIPVGNGNNDATEISCDYYQLTPDISFQQGAIWYPTQLNLNNPFDYSFQAFFGTNNGQGADGMTFVIQNQNQALGPAGTFGSQLGYGTFPGKSIGIEFDTHNNGGGAPYGDIAQHHIAIDTSGVQFPAIAGPVPALASGANLDDGNWHTIEIIWTPGTQTMTINFDGAQRLTYAFAGGLATTLFGGQTQLYWGWTGASGSKFNTQQIRIPLQADFVAGINYAHCGLDSVIFADSSTGGLHNLTYLWNFADGTNSTQQNVSHNYASSGIYNVTLTITSGNCISDTTIPVSAYSLPVIDSSETNITCNGLNNGVARGIVTGGTPAYTYTWSPAVSTIDSAQGLPPGNYALTVTDHDACTATASFTITQPPVLQDSLVQVNVLCNGQSTGAITAIATGGTPGYTYSWTPAVSTTSTAQNLPAGNYTSKVTDANGCTVTASTTITQPPVLASTLSDQNVLCYGSSTGYIILGPSGGVTPYTYNWSPNVSATDSAMNIAAGSYSVTLTDANGCSLTESAILTQPAQPLSITAVATPVLCYGQSTGTIVVSASGGTPGYTFLVTDGGVPVTSPTDTFNNLAPATYQVLVTDHNNCPDSTTATVNQPPQLVDILNPISPRCYHYHNGQIMVIASGGTPGPGYDYAFSNGVSDTSGIDANLPAGNYAVTVTDHSGCTITDSTILTQPDSVLIDVTPTPIQVKLGEQLQLNTTSNQTGTVTYNWLPDFGLSCYDCSDPVFNGVYSQPYTVLATNQDSCFGTFAFTVTVVPVYNVFFPNVFTPGHGGINALWQMFGEKPAIKQIQVSVFDRIGEKVFESNDIDFLWDGSFKGKDAPVGVYTYMARIVWLNNYTEKLFEGSITLLR
jgi:gliding motility-associated-like protein